MRIIKKYITDDFVEFYDQRRAIEYENEIYVPIKAILDKLGDRPKMLEFGSTDYIHVLHDMDLVDQVKWDLVKFLETKQMNRVNAIRLIFKKDHNFLKDPLINQSNIIITLLDRIFKIDNKCREWNCDLHLIPIYLF